MPILRSPRLANAGVGALAVAALGLTVPVSGAAAATVNSGAVTVSAAAKDPATASLRKAKVAVSATKPASATRSRWTLPVSGTPKLTASTVVLDGRLKFARGKRGVTFTSLRLSLGKKPAVSGTVGKRRVTVLTLSGSPKRDAGARTISLKGSKAALSPAAVRILRSKLGTSRVKAGRFGKVTVAVRVAGGSPDASVPPAPVVPAPPAPVPAQSAPEAPAPGVPAPPAPLVPAPPAPEAACWAPTPSGVTDWIGCGTQTGGNLRSWTIYIGSGGVTPTGSATTTPSGTGLDHRFVASTVEHPDGRVTITHAGGIEYFKSYGEAGDLDVRIENLRIVVSADRSSADVVLDATYNSMANPGLPPTSAPNVTAMTVNLAAARANTIPVAGTTTFEVAPATLTAAGRPIWSNYYTAGVAFGAFTITVPDPAS